MKKNMMDNQYLELEEIESKAKEYLDGILKVVQSNSDFLDGNLFYVDLDEAVNGIASDDLKEKRRNIVDLVKGRNEILEIGFNAGHSALLMLLANDKCNITIIDNCKHKYTEACFKYLEGKFPKRLRLIIGDSTEVINEINSTFDLIHYDGGKHHTIEKDLRNTLSLVNSNHVLVIDDTQNKKLSDIVASLEDEGLIETNKYNMQTERAKLNKWTHLIATFKCLDVGELKGLMGGAWDVNTHNMLYPGNFNKGLATFIVDKICPKDYLEFGSGLGLLANYVCNNSDINKAYCIEPYEINPENYLGHSPSLIILDIFNQGHPEVLNQRFNLVISIEVAEHIERKKHDYLFDFLVAHTNEWLIFSGGHIGQGGHGHIAERSQEDWKLEFIKRGMVFEESLTRELRHVSDEKNINHKKNLLIFRRAVDWISDVGVASEIDNFKNNYVDIECSHVYRESIELQRNLLNENIIDIDNKNEQIKLLKQRLSHCKHKNVSKDAVITRKDDRIRNASEKFNKLNAEMSLIKETLLYKIYLKKIMKNK